MEDKEPGQITVLLRRIKTGDKAAEAELINLVYPDLLRLARHAFQGERPGHTLQPSALISNLYIRLFGENAIDWQNKGHLYALSARTMRRILVDHAKQKRADKRPPPDKRVSLDDVFIYSDERLSDLLALDEALNRLERLNERQARVVELRHIVGLSIEETAAALGVADRTVKRDWEIARARLHAELNAHLSNDDSDQEDGSAATVH